MEEIVFKNLSFPDGINGKKINVKDFTNKTSLIKQGYSVLNILPVALERSLTTVYSFLYNPYEDTLWMMTDSKYKETSVTISLRVIWYKY